MAQPGTMPLLAQSEQLRKVSTHWCVTRDGDPYALELARRHYSAFKNRCPRKAQFVGPGKKLVLLSTDGKAVCAWRCFVNRCEPHQTGYNCALFRNEGDVKSSTLIREAVKIVVGTWGYDRCYTFVNKSAVKSSNPGYCFLKAGWKKVGTCKSGLLIFEFLPLP